MLTGVVIGNLAENETLLLERRFMASPALSPGLRWCECLGLIFHDAERHLVQSEGGHTPVLPNQRCPHLLHSHSGEARPAPSLAEISPSRDLSRALRSNLSSSIFSRMGPNDTITTRAMATVSVISRNFSSRLLTVGASGSLIDSAIQVCR